MLKAAAAKLSTIPALAGNSHLQPLQELFAAEELILHSYVHSSMRSTQILNPPGFSLQELHTGFDKISETLKPWVGGKAEDPEVYSTAIFPSTCCN